MLIALFFIWFRLVKMDKGGSSSSYMIGFCPEDWMDIPMDEPGTYVIVPPRVTNIPKIAAFLTISVEKEDKPAPLEAMRLDRAVDAQWVASTS